MKERPILFNTDMVQAILAGRKTQTRRVINPQPHPEFLKRGVHSVVPQWPMQDGIRWFMKDGCSELVKSAVGKPGDRLWVRESFRLFDNSDECGCSESPCGCPSTGTPIYYASNKNSESKWKPSIHMPRWACRIILEITSVRVERLQDISEADAVAEGFEYIGWRPTYADPDSGGEYATATDNFAALWDSVYKNWSENPWVWVVEFKVLTTNGKVQEVAA